MNINSLDPDLDVQLLLGKRLITSKDINNQPIPYGYIGRIDVYNNIAICTIWTQSSITSPATVGNYTISLSDLNGLWHHYYARVSSVLAEDNKRSRMQYEPLKRYITKVATRLLNYFILFYNIGMFLASAPIMLIAIVCVPVTYLFTGKDLITTITDVSNFLDKYFMVNKREIDND